MALGCSGLITEVRQLIGQGDNVVDNELITDARIMRWLNEAQEIIVDDCPEIPSLKFKNTTSIDFTEKVSYSFSDLSGGDYTENTPAYIFAVYFMDGANSRKLIYRFQDDFDEEWPDPTSSEIGAGMPKYWTRRNNTIEVAPRCVTAYCDHDMRIDGAYYAKDFSSTTGTRASDITKADDGLIMYAVANAFGALNSTEGEAKWLAKFNAWKEGYRFKQERLHGWDGNVFYEID